jgi:UDP-N-acetylmuramate--alanine ligase
MKPMIRSTKRKVHFMGAGGAGMSGLAEILLSLGHEVTGCDLASSDATRRLAALGAEISVGHGEHHAEGHDFLVVTAAIGKGAAEIENARRLRIPVVKRAELLGELMRLQEGIAIAGTHGKTTTTSMTGLILTEAGLDPTVLVGGRLHLWGTGARLGKGRHLVAEADEYDRSFLWLSPVLSVVTNVDADHLDCYRSLDDIRNTFVQFAHKTSVFGAVIVCVDDPGVGEILGRIDRRLVTYGFAPDADFRVCDETTDDDGGISATVSERGKELGRISLRIAGRHNLQNALAAIAVARELEIPFATISRALASFTGVVRRFERKGERNGIVLVDDYAHHPTEVSATLDAARHTFPERRVVALFQPHLYSRTRDFAEAFGRSLLAADRAVVTGIYAAREAPLEGVDGRLVSEAASLCGHRDVRYCGSKDEVDRFLATELESGDLLLTLGAGDVYRYGERWLAGEIVP